jgi:hypothetical protein
MSFLGRNFERILMANYNAPKWQGVKGVNIPGLNEVPSMQQLIKVIMLFYFDFAALQLTLIFAHRTGHPASPLAIRWTCPVPPPFPLSPTPLPSQLLAFPQAFPAAHAPALGRPGP